MQGPEHLVHPPPLSQAAAGGWMGRGTAGTPTDVHMLSSCAGVSASQDTAWTRAPLSFWVSCYSGPQKRKDSTRNCLIQCGSATGDFCFSCSNFIIRVGICAFVSLLRCLSADPISIPGMCICGKHSHHQLPGESEHQQCFSLVSAETRAIS